MRRALLAAMAFAALSSPVQGAELARLVSPAAGTELAAGSTMTIEWEGLDLPPGADEWEAFLSVDGGRTWPLRLTPHLDLSIRRFELRVPSFPTRDARLLLRFGDERTEVEMEMPQRFAISVRASAWTARPIPTEVALGRGERARPEDLGTVAWLEGSREGDGLREVVAWDPDSELREVHPAGRLLLLLSAPGPAREGLPPPATSRAPEPQPLVALEAALPRPAAVPVRLLIRRFNE